MYKIVHTDKIRVLHIASGDFFGNYGGGQVYVRNVAAEMARQGHEVAILSFVPGRASTSRRSYNGLTIFEIDPCCSDDVTASVIAGFHPDVVHAHSHKDVACRVGRRLGLPVVVTAHHGGLVCPAGTLMDMDDCVCHRRVNHKDCLPCVLRNIPGGRRLWHPIMKHVPEKTYRKLGNWLASKPFMLMVTPVGTAARAIVEHDRMWHEVCRDCSLIISPCRELADVMAINGMCREKIQVIPHGIPLPDTRPPFP